MKFNGDSKMMIAPNVILPCNVENPKCVKMESLCRMYSVPQNIIRIESANLKTTNGMLTKSSTLFSATSCESRDMRSVMRSGSLLIKNCGVVRNTRFNNVVLISKASCEERVFLAIMQHVLKKPSNIFTKNNNPIRK